MFSDLLKAAMKEAGMNATALSAATGIGKSSISQYCSGANIPPKSKQAVIALALGFDANYFEKDDSENNRAKGIFQLNLPVTTAAKLMSKNPAFIRIGLQKGIFPFGCAIQMESGKWSYYISPVKFAEYTGCKLSNASAMGENTESTDD